MKKIDIHELGSFQEGKTARINKVSQGACPYDFGLHRKAWLSGWFSEDTDTNCPDPNCGLYRCSCL